MYICFVLSNARRVLSPSNTSLRLLYLLNKNCVANEINGQTDSTESTLNKLCRVNFISFFARDIYKAVRNVFVQGPEIATFLIEAEQSLKMKAD